MATKVVIDRRLDDSKLQCLRPKFPYPKNFVNETLLAKYDDLPLPKDKILATYIWIDGSGENLRSKDITLNFIPKAPVDKFAFALDKLNAQLIENAEKDCKYSHRSKYLPPYFCPKNLENVYRVECSLRVSRNKDVFDENLKDLPMRTCDGYATGTAPSDNADMFLYPRAIYRDPFRQGNSILVMCDTYDANMKPTATNKRKACEDSYEKCKEDEPWFGIEQEFFFLDKDSLRPLGWPKCGFPHPQNHFHYQHSIGLHNIVARDLIEAHIRCCLYAGIPLCGSNAEIAPSQWEYQVGPCVGVTAGDDVWVSRYILNRLSELYGAVVTYNPKPIVGWNGSGAHTNFSHKLMREESGIKYVEKAIDDLRAEHKKHIKLYDPHGGKDNERRLIGTQETGHIRVFNAGVADRFASIRIPRVVANNKKGHLEDRRPASNCDPYSVVDILMRTCILEE